MIKNLARCWLQQLLGFDRYLFWFALVQITRMRLFRHDRAFLHFSAMLKGNRQILDIGANIGINTVILAREHPGSVIHAFEPLPQNIRALKRVVRFYRLTNVVVHETGLGETDMQANMLLPEKGGAAMHGLSHILEGTQKQDMIGHVFPVQVRKLDQLALYFGGTGISGIKIDVENYEWFVLRGAKETIQAFRPIIFCELWNNDRKQASIAMLEQMGYQAHVLKDKQLAVYAGENLLDYFFVPVNMEKA